MSILCLGRSIKINFADWLNEYGEDLWLLSSMPQFPLQHQYRYVRQFDDLDDGEHVLNIVAELANKVHFTRILPHSEFDLIRAAQLREYLDIPGQSVASAYAYRDKVLMKEYLHKADVEVAPFKRLGSWFDILDFCEQHGLPVVIKPVDGCSSKDVLVARTIKDAAQFFSGRTIDGWMIEKFIAGDMYHVNGVIDEDGAEFFAPCAYINNALDYQTAGIFGSRTIEADSELAKRLVAFTRRTIAALPETLPLGFHAEIFHTPDDRLFLCEIASRTAGSLTGELIEHTWGINIHKAWIQSCAGLGGCLNVKSGPREYAASIRVPVRAGQLVALPDVVPFDWAVTLCLTGRVGQSYAQATTYTDDVVSAMITANSDAQLTQRINQFIDWLNQRVLWKY